MSIRKVALLLAIALLLSACGQTQVMVEEQPPVIATPLPEQVPVTEELPLPTVTVPSEEEPSQTKIENTCTLSVRCDTIWENTELLDESLLQVLPPNGVVYAEQTLSFEEGESVFDLLRRTLTENKIHFEFSHTPVYDSVYIEGIANLYEFDCGALSGWMYAVNGTVPSVGISSYPIQNGDTILIWYTCDLGEDLK